MLKTKKLPRTLLAAAATLLAGPVLAQGLGNSPYSRLGLGEYTGNTGGVRQLGMGGTGLAAPNSGNVNELNPALLYYTPRTTWEAAFTAQVKSLSNASSSQRVANGTLGYLALAVPINKRWGAGIGLKPYSSVDYQATNTGIVNGDPNATAYKQYAGSGGLSEAYFASGFHILRDFNIGGSVSYFFGTIDQSTGTAIVTPTISAQQLVVENETLRYSDFLFRASAHYRHKFSDKLNLNLAGVQTFQANLRASRQRTAGQRDANGSALNTPVLLNDDAGHVLVPALTQLGLSLDNNSNWSASVDVSRQKWSEFRSFSLISTMPLVDTWRIAAGGEFTPDPGSVEHYFQRVTYRAGLSLSQLPYQPAGRHLYDGAAHWGFSFPLPTATTLESTVISLGFMYGIRGNTDYVSGAGGESNVREHYVRMQVGATLSNRWFIKRRLQ